MKINLIIAAATLAFMGLASCHGGDEKKLIGGHSSADGSSDSDAKSDEKKEETAKESGKDSASTTEEGGFAGGTKVEDVKPTGKMTDGGANAGDYPSKTTEVLNKQTRLGLKSAPQVFHSFGAITGVTAPSKATLDQYEAVKTSLPQFSNKLVSFDAGQQSAIVKLALNFCNDMVDNPTTAGAFFPGFDFGKAPSALSDADKQIVASNLSQRFWGSNLNNGMDTSSKEAQVATLLSDLIGGLADKNNAANTKNVVKGSCAAVAASLEVILL